MTPTNPPSELLNTLSSICKEWKKCGGFLCNYNECVIQYLVDYDSFCEELSITALNDLSHIVSPLDVILQHMYIHPDPIFNSLVRMPRLSIHDDWFLRDGSSGFRSVYMELRRAILKDTREDYFRGLERLRYSKSLIEEVIEYPGLRTYLENLLESVNYWDDTHAGKKYDFIFHILYIVHLLNGFHHLEIKEYLTCHHQNGYLANLISDYYHKAMSLNGEICPFSDLIGYDSVVKEILEYEDDLSNLHVEIGEIYRKKEQAKKERIFVNKTNYENTLRICDYAFGKRIKVFSYCRSVYHLNEEIVLYDGGTIVVYGRPFNLKDLTGIIPQSETSEELVFGEERITVVCFKPENLLEFNSYLLS